MRTYASKRKHQSEYVFESRVNPQKAIHRKTLRDIVKNASERAGINKKIRPHSFRRTLI